MPTYELTCRECGHHFEKFLTRLLRNDDLVCPECGSTWIERGVGGGFLGSGTRAPGGSVSGSTASSCGSRGFS